MSYVKGHQYPSGPGFSKRYLYIKYFGSVFRGPGLRNWTPPAGYNWRGRKKQERLQSTGKRKDIGSIG